jgi:predicted glycoside hydrolase/deacetylase ChbG (UPF0249 family)
MTGRTLIVNADDLGLHPDIDRGIERAHREGVVTSTSLSPVGESFENGVELCGRCPELDVGVHLTLVGERPLTDAAALGGLVRRDGAFSAGHRGLLQRVLAGWVSRAALRTELEAQLGRVLDAGLRPSHLDSHQHVHLLPGIWPVVRELALAHGIGWIRVPVFTPLADGRPGALVVALRLGLNALRRWRAHDLGRLRSADTTPALGLSGHLTVETVFAGLDRVPAGATAELVVHPGENTPALESRYDWGYDWSGETAAVTDPRLADGIAERGFTLRRFSDWVAA